MHHKLGAGRLGADTFGDGFSALAYGRWRLGTDFLGEPEWALPIRPKDNLGADFWAPAYGRQRLGTDLLGEFFWAPTI